MKDRLGNPVDNRVIHALKKPPRGKYPYKGVRLLEGRWESRGHYQGKHVFLGMYDTIEEAARRSDEWRIGIWGRENIWLNFPEGGCDE
jgi:hypothetical protein